MTWPCFWVEPSDQAIITLRRFTFSQDKACPAYEFGHNASSEPIGQRQMVWSPHDGKRYVGALEPDSFEGHPAWPVKCEACEYCFEPDDRSQANQELIWRTPDRKQSWPQKSLPAGACFDAWWAPDNWRGPDGVSLCVVLPDCCTREHAYRADSHFWIADGPSTSGGHWNRVGDLRADPISRVSVTPSIDAKGSCYHGYLTDGILVDPL